MDDNRVWAFEESLWTGDADHYRESIDESCVMVLPAEPFVLESEAAIAKVAGTPRWTRAAISDGHIVRPQEGLIVVAYKVVATRDQGEGYTAWCTSTYRRLEHEVWKVVQHSQTVPPVAGGAD